MELATSPIFLYLSQYAYEPLLVYSLIIVAMFLSSFGIPIPEEVTLLSAGLLVYMGKHPDIYPPPYAGAPVVELHTTAVICFLAVFLSDLLVFYLGRTVGQSMLRGRFFSRLIQPHHWSRVQGFTERYGYLACGIFRFTPGIRFPGHFACGSVGIPTWKFVLVDGAAALISVPTQVYLIGIYGEIILSVLKDIKLILLAVAIAYAVYWIVTRLAQRRRRIAS